MGRRTVIYCEIRVLRCSLFVLCKHTTLLHGETYCQKILYQHSSLSMTPFLSLRPRISRLTLLVVATGDASDDTSEFITDAAQIDLGAHALLHQDTQLAVIFDFDELLRPVGRVGNVQLHDGEGEALCVSCTA